MPERDELRRAGREVRSRLGLGDEQGAELAPGLTDLTDELVFGSVWSRPGLELEDRMVATLSALTCKQYVPQLHRFIGAALHIGMSPRLVQEVLLHCGMYAGMPSAASSLRVVSEVLDQLDIPHPVDVLSPAAEVDEVDLERLYARGLETMNVLHDERARDGYAAPDSAAADLYDTAIHYLYGEIWNRSGITTRQRMICSVASFTALQMEGQQRKFFRSALNVGLAPTEVIEVIAQTAPYSGFPPALNALTVAESVLGAGSG
ncbi:MAG: carboxymuconolactone decarboxylase family protein [Acidimicrobiia bacterium]|nr:carboxymuconolactone decarboxylase family protein [Acidimicrobiia bacterium]